ATERLAVSDRGAARPRQGDHVRRRTELPPVLARHAAAVHERRDLRAELRSGVRTATQLTIATVALLLCGNADAQTREQAAGGVFVADASGRYIRQEGRDGVIVTYLYDTPATTETSGLAVRVTDALTLTVRYRSNAEVTVAGLPALVSRFDEQGRTVAVTANGATVATLDYTKAGYVSSVTLPGHLTWTISGPDQSHRVRQSVQNGAGRDVRTAEVTARMEIDGVRRGAAYEAIAAELGLNLESITFDESPTGALTTMRDQHGAVLLYIVHTDACDAGFAPDGTARFYDLELSVLGGFIPPGSDVRVSPAWEVQRGTMPDHLLLTNRGA